MSLATTKQLLGLGSCHSQDVLELHEMIELRLLFRGQRGGLFALDKFGDAPLRFGRRAKMSDLGRSGSGRDKIDDLEVGGAGRTHSAFILLHLALLRLA